MTDREKIRAYIEKLHKEHRGSEGDSIFRRALRTVLFYIDSLQEKPVSIWHDASEKPERENLVIETNDGRLIHRQSINNYGMVKRWAYTSDLLNLDNSCNFGNNSQAEPVSEEWIEELKTKLDSMSKEEFEKVFDKYAIDFKEVPVSEDLENEIQRYYVDWDEHPEYVQTAKHFAKWQKEQFEKNRLEHCNSITNEQAVLEQCFIDQHLDKHQRMPTFLDAIEYGMQFMKEKMMANAIDVEVKVDAGGYPYIDRTIELYDYDKDEPLAAEGDKYKVILIKED